MKITVLFFAGVRDLVGNEREEIELPSHVRCIADVRGLLEARHAALKGALDAVRLAKNEEFVDADAPVAEGDVVALIPPVSGG